MADLPQRPSPEDVLRDAASNGWDFFAHPADRERNPAEHVPEDRMARLTLAAAVLWDEVAEFRDVVGFLVERTLGRAAWVAQLGLPMDQAYGYGVFREGQNAAVALLFKLIAEGKKLQPPAQRDP